MNGNLHGTGVLYCATGERYIAEALSSARSLGRWWKGQCLVTCDHLPNNVPTALEAKTQEPEQICFRCVAPSGNPYADKIRTIIDSPFERTIYLDSDTYVAANLDSLFALLDRYDIAAAHAPGYRGQLDPEVPSAFYELNTGVLAYRSSPLVRHFLRTWLATYEDWLRRPPFEGAAKNNDVADQPAFRRCLWESGLAFYVLGPEYNYRFNFPGTLVAKAYILHGRHKNIDRIAGHLNRYSGPRTFSSFTNPALSRAVDFLKSTLRGVASLAPRSSSHGAPRSDQAGML